jgi:hypothetical protein
VEIVELIERVGFPVFVAVFVLVRVNRKMEKLTEAIYKLIRVMDRKGDE